MNVLFSSINSIYRTVQQTPTDLKNLSGLLFVSCVLFFAFTCRRGRRPLQEIANFLMRRSLLPALSFS